MNSFQQATGGIVRVRELLDDRAPRRRRRRCDASRRARCPSSSTTSTSPTTPSPSSTTCRSGSSPAGPRPPRPDRFGQDDDLPAAVPAPRRDRGRRPARRRRTCAEPSSTTCGGRVGARHPGRAALRRDAARQRHASSTESVDDAELRDVFAALGLDEWLDELPGRARHRARCNGSRPLGRRGAARRARPGVPEDPGLVVLDEASSRLDPHTEQLLEHAITRLLARPDRHRHRPPARDGRARRLDPDPRGRPGRRARRPRRPCRRPGLPLLAGSLRAGARGGPGMRHVRTLIRFTAGATSGRASRSATILYCVAAAGPRPGDTGVLRRARRRRRIARGRRSRSSSRCSWSRSSTELAVVADVERLLLQDAHAAAAEPVRRDPPRLRPARAAGPARRRASAASATTRRRSRCGSMDGVCDLIGRGLFAVVAAVVMWRIDPLMTVAAFAPVVVGALVSDALGTRSSRYGAAALDCHDRAQPVPRRDRQRPARGAGRRRRGARASRRLADIGETRRRLSLRDRVFGESLNSMNYHLVHVSTGAVLLLGAGRIRNGVVHRRRLRDVRRLPRPADLPAGRDRTGHHRAEAHRRLDRPDARADARASRGTPSSPRRPSTCGTTPRSDRPAARHATGSIGSTCPASRAGIPPAAVGSTTSPSRSSGAPFTVVTGRIGAGKTTLLHALLGLLPCDAGEIRWNGGVDRRPGDVLRPAAVGVHAPGAAAVQRDAARQRAPRSGRTTTTP